MSLAEESTRLAERLPDGLLQNIIARLNPQRVIVFGSQATGKTHADSDWDLLIVVDDDIPPERLHWRAIHDLRRGIDAAIDLILYRQSSFRFEEDVVGTLPWIVANEGVVIYEREAPPKEWIVARRRLALADGNVAVAELLVSQPRPLTRAAAFHCQQAAEKIAKALLIAFRTPPPNTHDLAELAAVLSQRDVETSDCILQLRGLTKWYVAGRYPTEDDDEPGITDVISSLSKLRALRQHIDSLSPLP